MGSTHVLPPTPLETQLPAWTSMLMVMWAYSAGGASGGSSRRKPPFPSNAKDSTEEPDWLGLMEDLGYAVTPSSEISGREGKAERNAMD